MTVNVAVTLRQNSPAELSWGDLDTNFAALASGVNALGVQAQNNTDGLAQFEADLASSDPTKGAAMVGYAAPGYGAAARKQADKNADSISVREYILTSDAGDHALAWKRAIQQAAGRPIDVSGAWTFLTELDASGYDMHLFGRAAIDATSVAAAYPITMGGTLGSSAALGADVAKGAAGITCALSVQPGDIIKIVSTDLWSTERSYYYKGELQRVLSVSGGVIYLQGQLNDGYTAATTTVTKINAAKVRIDNEIEINRQKDTQGAFLIQWAKDLAVNRLSTIQARERGIYVKECLGGYVADGKTVASFPAGGSSNYGLIYDSCAEISTLRGNYHAGRHGIATGGTFPCRDLLFDRCIVDNDTASGVYCLDAHANGERFTYRNVISRNGCAIQSIDVEIYGGLYKTNNYASALVFTPSRNNNKYLIVGGVFDASNLNNGYGINLQSTIAGLNLGVLKVIGARLYANRPFFYLPFTSGTTTVPEVTLDNVEAISTGTASTAGIYVNTNTQNPVINLFRLMNSVVSSPANGPCLTLSSGAVTFGEVQITNNQMTQAGAFDVGYVKNATLVKAYGNTFIGSGGALRLEFETCATVDCRNNRFTGFASVGGLYLNGTTGQNIAIDNTTDGTFSFPNGTIIGYTSNGKRIMQSGAAPTSGAYVVGEIVYNTSPTAGGPAGWECVAAGSPGTWREFGLISGAVAVASLRSASTAGIGARSFVSDANATTFNSVVAGGGVNVVPVFSDGTSWRIG